MIGNRILRITAAGLWPIFLVSTFAVGTAFASDHNLERFKTVLNEARLEQQVGHHKNAIKIFKKVYIKSPELRREALSGLVASLNATAKFEDSIEFLNDEIAERPFVGETRVWLAEAYLGSQKFRDALAQVNIAEKIMGRQKALVYLKAKIQQKLDQHPEAIETLNSILTENPQDHQALLGRGESYSKLGQHSRAYGDAKAAGEIKPFDEPTLTTYVKAAFHAREYVDLERIGRRCVEIYSKNATCLEYLGKLALEKQDLTRATGFYEAAVAQNPNQPDVRLQLAESLAHRGDLAASDFQFELLLKQHPTYEPALRSWAPRLQQRKKTEALGAALKKFNEEAPESTWAAVEYAKLLMLIGDVDGAVDKVKTAAQTNELKTSKFYYAYFLYLAGRYSKSRSVLEDIEDVRFEPNFHLGLTFFKEDKLKEAVQHWQKVAATSALRPHAEANASLALQQINSRKPAASTPNPPTANPQYFLEWKLPQL